eukprot:scaffold31518_cov56-Cyclotella_meneghiniana.AAC.5
MIGFSLFGLGTYRDVREVVHLKSDLTAHSTYPLPPSQWNDFQTNQHVMFTSAHVFMWSSSRVPPGKSYSALHRIRLQQNKL